jgi:hypothetical protein
MACHPKLPQEANGAWVTEDTTVKDGLPSEASAGSEGWSHLPASNIRLRLSYSGQAVASSLRIKCMFDYAKNLA